MEDFASPLKNPIISVSASSNQDEFEDACSICFEPFSSVDPSAVTKCKHEYHLQCILEWSQRSKECPICWQLLVLKDPGSQELLAAVEIERNSRSRHGSSNLSTFRRISYEDIESDHVGPYTDDSDFDDSIMQHIAASAMGRAHHFSRRESHRSYVDRDIFLGFAAPSNGTDVLQTNTSTPVEGQNLGNLASPEVNSGRSVMSSERYDQPPSTVLSSCLHTGLNITDNRHGSPRPGVCATQTPPCSPRRSRPSDLLSFSESLKSRFSAASARYKESISKGTRGIKEKLLPRNNSVKELSRDVQREVTAGISGVARMMGRLDLTSKQTGPSSGPITSGAVGTSGLLHYGKVVQENLTQSCNGNDGKIVHGTSSNAPVLVSGTLSSVPPRHMKVTLVQSNQFHSEKLAVVVVDF
ncbi:zinc finger protein [Macleaya cordata]|uniref:RING-type E3 ubiquitin transferase n=1 Tax=Macleaya cordata TaxID=56857 RepID=A0A200Q5M8_MACCD|nr:zinc finger protein [Macleaya cordata]